jgi:2-dehydro-3-deoxyphosphogluconate aldolase/(4S)-4-hydroxy-2-oxoglutarate aldolase
MHALFRGISVIPVLTIERERDAVPLARALFEGGLPVIEITLRTAAAPAAIAAIARELPQTVVGAGTLLRAADIAMAVHAGARFLVSPGLTPELASAALSAELPYLPGVATPSEVMAARALGICVMKLFPAEALGGAAWLKALATVFPGVAFCPDPGSMSERRGISGAAERADGRRLVDGPEGCDRRRRLAPRAPPRRARRRDRPARGRLAAAPRLSRAVAAAAWLARDKSSSAHTGNNPAGNRSSRRHQACTARPAYRASSSAPETGDTPRTAPRTRLRNNPR